MAMDAEYGHRFGSLRRRARACLAASAALLLAACAAAVPHPEVTPPLAPAVDAQKLGGQWYVIAHVPYAEERDEQDSSIELRPRDDGGFDEIYHYYDGKLMQTLARPRSRYMVVAGSNNARWISHSRALDSQMDLDVFYVDPEYRFAVIGEEQHKLGWIYARDPEIDPATYRNLVAQLDQRGYNVAQLHRLSHTEVLVGKTQIAVP
jgi:apolipoprotein D and lipocalin family protein